MVNDILECTIDFIGFMGPAILIVIYSLVLTDIPDYLSVFVIGSATNILLNKVLKYIIKEPRPSNPINYSSKDNTIYTNEETYGMPSGHTQWVGFSVMFFFIIRRSPIWLLVGLIISVLTFNQRLKYKRHTLSQLIVGYITGMIFSIATLCIYWVAKKLAMSTGAPKNISGILSL